MNILGSNMLLADAFKQTERNHLLGRHMVSNEAEDVSGRTAAEIERVIYLRVKDFSFLDKAVGADRQEQWSIKIEKNEENAGSGSIRVRKSINLREPGADIQYILTTKLDIGTKGSAAETSEQSSVDQFNVFKYFANKGMLKDRYYFPIEGTGTDLRWEVDCFPKEGAMYHDWIKVDLEKWPRGKELPPFPFEFVEMMDGSEGMQNDENAEKISQLYETIFLTKNTMTPLVDYGNSEQPDPNSGNTDEEGQKKENDQPAGGATATDPNADATGQEGQTDNTGGEKTEGQGDDGQEGQKKEGDEGEGDNAEGKDNFGNDVTQATKEAFSSAGQVLTQLIPIIGPLVTVAYAQRGMDGTSQHTEKTTSHISADGTKSERKEKTGSYILSDLTDAKDYVNRIERSVAECVSKIKQIDRIEMTLWPQKDGRFSSINIRTDRDGETRVFTENNPGKLKWWSTSLAGKRIIKLRDEQIKSFKFNNRSISCTFDGKEVEFDVSQLRAFKYQTVPKGNEFDIVEFNFDA